MNKTDKYTDELIRQMEADNEERAKKLESLRRRHEKEKKLEKARKQKAQPKPNGRRLNGEGAINKVEGASLYRGRVWVRQPNGELKRMQLYGKTRGEVRDKIRDAKRLAKAGISPTKNETVAQYLLRWYDKDTTLRPKSIHSRKVNIDRMTPHIGGLKLRELGATHIEAMYKILADELSEYSLRQVNAVLRKAMKDAIKEGSILYSPIDRVLKQPTVKHPREMETLSEEEAQAILDINDDWTPLFTLFLGTGLRDGEALGLKWSNVDLTNPNEGSLTVTRSLSRVPLAPEGKRFTFNDPKTPAAGKTIPLNPEVVSALKTHQARQASQRLSLGSNWKDQGLVFPNEWGSPLEPTRVYRALKRTLRKIADTIDRGDKEKLQRWEHLVKTLRVHDLRHTCATLMVEKDVHAKKIQGMMRHAHYSTTMDVYVHTNTETLRDAANTLGEAIAR